MATILRDGEMDLEIGEAFELKFFSGIFTRMDSRLSFASPCDVERLPEAAALMYSALQVILRTPDVYTLLANRDPKALEQVEIASDFYARNCMSRG